MSSIYLIYLNNYCSFAGVAAATCRERGWPEDERGSTVLGEHLREDGYAVAAGGSDRRRVGQSCGSHRQWCAGPLGHPRAGWRRSVARQGLRASEEATRQGLRVAEEATERTEDVLRQTEKVTREAELRTAVFGA